MTELTDEGKEALFRHLQTCRVCMGQFIGGYVWKRSTKNQGRV